MANHRVEHCVEQLCQKGCRAVWGDIEILESGGVLTETTQLSPAEVSTVLNELKTIMTCYDGTCSPS